MLVLMLDNFDWVNDVGVCQNLSLSMFVGSSHYDKSQLFWCEHKGYKLLTHSHVWTSLNPINWRPVVSLSPGGHEWRPMSPEMKGGSPTRANGAVKLAALESGKCGEMTGTSPWKTWEIHGHSLENIGNLVGNPWKTWESPWNFRGWRDLSASRSHRFQEWDAWNQWQLGESRREACAHLVPRSAVGPFEETKSRNLIPLLYWFDNRDHSFGLWTSPQYMKGSIIHQPIIKNRGFQHCPLFFFRNSCPGRPQVHTLAARTRLLPVMGCCYMSSGSCFVYKSHQIGGWLASWRSCY